MKLKKFEAEEILNFKFQVEKFEVEEFEAEEIRNLRHLKLRKVEEI